MLVVLSWSYGALRDPKTSFSRVRVHELLWLEIHHVVRRREHAILALMHDFIADAYRDPTRSRCRCELPRRRHVVPRKIDEHPRATCFAHHLTHSHDATVARRNERHSPNRASPGSSLRKTSSGKRVANRGADGVSRTRAIDDQKYSPLPIEVEQWNGFRMEDLQPAFDRGDVCVVGATFSGSPRETGPSHVVRHVEINHSVRGESGRCGQRVCLLRLRDRARNAVEDVAACFDRANECIPDNRENQIVGDKIASAKAIAHLASERTIVRDAAPEQFATRYVPNTKVLRERRPLGALARAGCTQQDKLHAPLWHEDTSCQQ